MLLTSSLLSVFVFSFVVGFGAVVSPGPVTTAIVSQTPRRGWLAGPLVASGHVLLELVIVILIAIGLGSGLAKSGVQIVIAILGGVLLLWMGGGMIWSVWQGKVRLPKEDEGVETMSRARLVGLGMLATIGNPFWYAWWVTVGAGYLAQVQAFSAAAIGAFYLGHISADYAWDTALSTVVAGGRRWITDGLYRGIIVFCGAFFIYLGVVFLIHGVGGLG
jgi:threonine/homoserine/homoserine lactone efflux protein